VITVEITDVRIRRVKDGGRLKAVATITIGEDFVVHELKVVEGTNGYFISMPSRRLNDGDYFDIAHPITTEAREQIQNCILDAYHSTAEKDAAEDNLAS
jgi:stage V sporulation protein G